MIGSDKSATRFAGQIGNISQFLPQGGFDPSKTAEAVLYANSVKENSGLLAQGKQLEAQLGTAGLVQGAHEKGRMTKAEGELAATKTLLSGKMQISQQDAAGDAAQFGGWMKGLTGLATGGLGFAKNAGMFGGGLTTGPDIGANEATNRWANPSLHGMSPSEVMEGQLGGFSMTPRDPITHPWK